MDTKTPADYEWYHLPYHSLTSGKLSIVKTGEESSLKSEDMRELWIGTGWHYIAELLSQIEFAHGRVLVTGLGLGLVALLVADKPEVSEIVVVENSQDVIDLFSQQGFDTSKMRIVCDDATTFSDGPFDCLLLDHYNQLGSRGVYQFVKMCHKIRENNGSVGYIVPFNWTLLESISGNKFAMWRDEIYMPDFSEEEVSRYINAETQATDAIPDLLSSLKRINSKRKT